MKNQTGPAWNYYIKPLVMALLALALFSLLKADFLFAAVRPVLIKIGLRNMGLRTYYCIVAAVSFFLPGFYCTKYAFRTKVPRRMIIASVLVLVLTAVYALGCVWVNSFATEIAHASALEIVLQYLLGAVIFVPMNLFYSKYKLRNKK